MDETETDDPSVVGEACHIVAQSEAGPRGASTLTREDRDKYANLILLCNVHHKVIDDQPGEYTVDKLHEMKDQHEAWVRDTLHADPAKQRDDETYAAIIDEWARLCHLEDWDNSMSGLMMADQPRLRTAVLDDLKRVGPTPESPDGAVESAVVSDDGTLASVTDENGSRTCYSYDAIGRLSSITWPSETTPGVCDASAWAPTIQTFAQVGGAEYGIATGHWRQEVVTGNARKLNYLDAFWRPLVSETYDAADPTNTRQIVVKRYDVAGMLAYQSYPLRSLSDFSSPTFGTRNFYDALSRITRVEQDSELGVLTMTTQYLPGLQTLVTSPRLQTTTNTYMAWDEPGYDLLIRSEQPEGKVVELSRDHFLGFTTSLRQSSNDNTVSSVRSYVYDANQRLCKVVEPETGALVTEYDAAGNVAWTAAGLNLSSATECNRAEAASSDRVVTRQYDARDRLTTISYTDANVPGERVSTYSQDWRYRPDGKVQSVRAVNRDGWAETSYGYNRRGLPTTETLTHTTEGSWSVGYGYDRNANLAAVSYPSGRSVDYEPNALGQPARAGLYATGVTYHPNGAMAQFIYGNGIVHALTQNARGLPDRSLETFGSAAILDDGYDYDADANVVAITDGARAGRGNRDLAYDGLGRLVSAVSPMFGAASYRYDALDNLLAVKANGRDHTYYYDASWRLTNVLNTDGETISGLDYDAQGNLTNKNGMIFKFDHTNRLREVAGVEKYDYDGYGRRVLVTSGKGNVLSLYGQDGVLRYQRDQRRAKATEYVYLNGSLVARVSDVIAPFVPRLTVDGYSITGEFPIKWSAVEGAIDYELQEQSGGGAWQSRYTGSGLGTSVSGRTTGIYGYRVRARNDAGYSAWSAVIAVSVLLPPTGVPTIAAQQVGVSGNYPVSWSEVAGATRYAFQESFNSGDWAPLGWKYENRESFQAKPAGSYAYRVAACNEAGCGGFSASALVTVIYPPDAPSITAQRNNYDGAYTINWTAMPRADYYLVDERFNGGAWSQVHNAASLSVPLAGRVTGTYGYRARACSNLAECGAYSAEASVIVLLPPAAPSLSAPASNLGGNFTVTWSASWTATRYQFEERIGAGNWTVLSTSNTTSIDVTGRRTGSHQYRVAACNVRCGSYSVVASVAVTSIPPPSTITAHHKHLLIAGPIIQGSCFASWSPSAGAATYTLRAYQGSMTYTTAQTDVMGDLSQAYCAYQLEVQACNAAGCSAWSPPSVQTYSEEIYEGGGTNPGEDPR